MAARKEVGTSRQVLAYVFGDDDGSSLSDAERTVDDATREAAEWLAQHGDSVYATSQTIFALVPVRRVALGGVTVTDIKE